MSELKTLAELWKEAGEKPFDADLLDSDDCRTTILGISPTGYAVGWSTGSSKNAWPTNIREWKRAPPALIKFEAIGYAWVWKDCEGFELRKSAAGSERRHLLGCKRFEVTVTEGEFDV